ncbi:MAG: histidinol dehydrogenase [Oscillospiraceae bacterium]|nr:histidinol dehydrogenase [Oscillospiraceae bacterium]
MIRIMRAEGLSDADVLLRDVQEADVTAAVTEILAAVRQRGDSALRDYSEKFDGGAPKELEVSREEWEEAVASVDPELLAVLEEAAENIRRFHRHQVLEGFSVTDKEGIVLGQKVMPLQRVGLYVPGGTASYPSTVLMDCIPAKIAGVGEIIMVTPAKNGVIRPVILAAAKIAGVDRIFRVGGAQAVAALAYGTETVPRVDKIVGPGNRFVAQAKRLVYGQVDIDMIAGPSEVLIVADGRAEARFVAADMLAQAEHDRMATAVLVTDSIALAEAVAAELELQLPLLEREEIARASIENNGKIIVVRSVEEAIAMANRIAPEHLELCLEDAMRYLEDVRNAGSVFLGRNSPEALGDYFAGPNHTLPTSGTARFASPLSVYDFIKRTSYIQYSADALEAVSGKIDRFAREEGLTAHARSVTVRFEEGRK